MTITIPDWLSSVAEVAAGHFPEADEDALWRMKDAYEAAAASVRQVTQDGETVTQRSMVAMQGQANLALDQYWKSFSTGDEAYLTQLEQLCTDLANSCDAMALEAEYTKMSVIAALVALVAQIAALVASSFATFGAASTAIPAAMAGTRAIIMAILRKMIEEIIKAVAINVATTVGLQSIQMLEGHRSLGQFDTAKLTEAVTSGVASGAVGGLTGFGADKLGAHVLGDAATRGERVAVGAASGSVTGALNAQGSSLLQGHGPASLDDTTRGSISGTLSGATAGSNEHNQLQNPHPPATPPGGTPPTPAPVGTHPAPAPAPTTPPAGNHPAPPPAPAPPPTPAGSHPAPAPPPAPAGSHPAAPPAPSSQPGGAPDAAAGGHPGPAAPPTPPHTEQEGEGGIEIPEIEASGLDPEPMADPADGRPIPALNLP